jgi:hypothetical protein
LRREVRSVLRVDSGTGAMIATSFWSEWWFVKCDVERQSLECVPI